MFYFVGIIITFFLSALLITKKNKSKSDWILAAWLTIIGIHLTFFYLYISDQYYKFPLLLGFDRPLPLLQGPFLYLYTAYSTDQVKNKYAMLHFLPWLAAHLFMIQFFLLSLQEKVEVYQNSGAGYETVTQILIWSINISGVVYVILSLQLLRTHKRNIEQEFSNTVKVSLAWLRYLIFGIGFIWLMVLYGDDFLIFGSVVLFVIFLGYFGIRQDGIFTHGHPIAATPENAPEASAPENGENDQPEVKKYQKSGLNDEAALEVHHRLSHVMENEKLFKNPELTLPELSQKLDIHPNILSQVINSRVGKNFYDYINSLRVEDFKKMVLHPESQKYSLLGLATQCGFNSKTTFNRNFKKATGLSPSEYLRQNNIQLE